MHYLTISTILVLLLSVTINILSFKKNIPNNNSTRDKLLIGCQILTIIIYLIILFAK